MKRRTAIVVLSLVGVLIAGISPTAVIAAPFQVHMCKAPDGSVLGTEGWTAINPQSGVYYDLSCLDGQFGVSTGPLSAPLPRGYRTGWQFDLPKPMTLTSLAVEGWSSVTEWSGWSAQIWARLHDQPNWLNVTSCDGANCTMPFVSLPAYDAGSIGFGISCSYSACAAGSYAAMHLNQVILTVDDPASPAITTVDGSLLHAGQLAGMTAISFTANDYESGVRTAYLEVDGRVVAAKNFDTTTTTCHEPFTRVDPCPKAVADSLGFDTAALSDGPHSARLLVYDASGAHPGVAGPWAFTTSNSRVANLCAAPVGPGASISPRHPSVRYGHGTSLGFRWPAIPWPAAQAVLLVGRDHLSVMGRAVAKGPTRYVLELRPRQNRIVRIGVRPAGSTGPYYCSGPRRVAVRAGVSLKARPRQLTNGHAVRLRGRLAGRRAVDRTIILEARAKGGRRAWTPVKVLHAGRRGRFSFRYAFERTYMTTRYLFRARVPVQRGFPYAAGRSGRRRVVVDP
jgi:hypothetical protein